MSVGVADSLPILHGGEAPQVGHARLYDQSEIPVYRYEIQQIYPHDTADYTEALFMHDGFLYEWTGQYGRSRLKKWNLATGEVKSVRELEARYFMVRDGYGEVGFLNELEYVDGNIFANVWQTDYLVRFSAETGAVNGWVDLSGLNPNPTRLVYPHVLNGVAYNGEPGTLLVTGKNWPNLWHIKLVEAPGVSDPGRTAVGHRQAR
ncbi:MAG: hypothetical protein C1943_07290 [Halochromatium sp.]|nr:hypothetical protein [Halochromatium sp.]